MQQLAPFQRAQARIVVALFVQAQHARREILERTIDVALDVADRVRFRRAGPAAPWYASPSGERETPGVPATRSLRSGPRGLRHRVDDRARAQSAAVPTIAIAGRTLERQPSSPASSWRKAEPDTMASSSSVKADTDTRWCESSSRSWNRARAAARRSALVRPSELGQKRRRVEDAAPDPSGQSCSTSPTSAHLVDVGVGCCRRVEQQHSRRSRPRRERLTADPSTQAPCRRSTLIGASSRPRLRLGERLECSDHRRPRPRSLADSTSGPTRHQLLARAS